jgi:hypothetical protein
MPKILCKKYLSGSENEKHEASAWKLPKIVPSNKNKYVEGP